MGVAVPLSTSCFNLPSGAKRTKSTSTFLSASSVRAQTGPLQSRLKPENAKPLLGGAVTVTAVPTGKRAVQVNPPTSQARPSGLIATVPPPGV